MVTKMELFVLKKNTVTQKDIICKILILFVHDKYRSDKLVTFHNDCSKISLSTSMHFAARV